MLRRWSQRWRGATWRAGFDRVLDAVCAGRARLLPRPGLRRPPGRKWRRLRQEPQSAPALRITSFPQLVALAGEKRDLLTKAALEADVRLVRIEDGRLEIALEPQRRAAWSTISPASWNNGPAGAGP